ncbi:MAG: hypothetical protein JWL71_2026 [Acidobacteria bacterium]|nr:hypothetical protein [Acidobacteriota bacterium]
MRYFWLAVAAAVSVIVLTIVTTTAAGMKAAAPQFQTSDRCVACHNGLTTASGEDISIGNDWRTTMMANSSRDPYWQASVRRESIDHPSAKSAIEDECSICHMPITRYSAKLGGRRGEVFSHLPFARDEKEGRQAADGVSCSVCHQISPARLGTRESFNGGFVIAPPVTADERPEYGPFQIEAGHTRIMRTSSEGYRPTQSDHIRQSEICATCHTLMTEALGPDGKPAGRLPEQVPYQEWLHSEFKASRSCQSCHMPAVGEPVAVTRVFGVPRDGVSRHTFVGANFFMQRMLNRYRDALDVTAPPQELATAADRTGLYLGSQAATVAIEELRVEAGRLRLAVAIENLGGHKLPTAYPSRRAWLHVVVRDGSGRPIFESGAVNPDGSICGNDNDADAAAFEPHYTEITAADQVQIYESVIADTSGAVTTGLLTGVRYIKDNRLLPRGFDKRTAEPDIAVQGGALDDPDFLGGSDRVRYAIALAGAQGPFVVDAELLYQPIGYRWATNLKAYGGAAEPQRFTTYYDAMAASATTRLAATSRSAAQ